MPKKGTGKTLFVRKFPPDLFRLIEGTAEFLDIRRDEIVIRLLRGSLKKSQKSSDELKQWFREFEEGEQ